MKQRLVYPIFLVALAAYVGLGAGIFHLNAADESDDPYKQLEIFTRVLEKVRKEYVDGENLTYQDLIQSALRGMLSNLDPHSEFMEAAKYNELREDTGGSYGGVGLNVNVRDNQLVVIAPMEDTPAFEAGIMPGDQIVKIDGKSTERFNMGDAIKRLRGEAGSQVTLSIMRSSLSEPKDFVLTRQDIRVFTAKDINNRRDFPLGDDKVGYVRLTQFGERTADELESALVTLESKGMESLVLDLRGNPGGLLDQAVAVSEKFLDRGEPIVSTEGRSRAGDVKRKAAPGGKTRRLPLAVLINGGSASASEIVAGCLQDLDRARIVGEQSFGKGSVQNILPLTDGTALRLTTAKYYTPSHKVIHEKGIEPDIIVSMTEDEEIAVQLRRIPGGRTNLDEALRFYPADRQARLRELVLADADAQFERARDFLKSTSLFSKRQRERAGKPAAKPLN
jgi:carboxyl-terminal processing protease